MKKLLLLFPLIFLTACTIGPTSEEIQHRRNIEIEREKQRTIQLEMKAKIEASKTPEQRAQERQIELAKQQADSMKYLENSKKVHDTVEAVGIGLRIFDALSN